MILFAYAGGLWIVLDYVERICDFELFANKCHACVRTPEAERWSGSQSSVGFRDFNTTLVNNTETNLLLLLPL